MFIGNPRHYIFWSLDLIVALALRLVGHVRRSMGA
jgi:hypothetical protein